MSSPPSTSSGTASAPRDSSQVLLSPRILAAVGGSPLVEVEVDGTGHPAAATAFTRIERPPAAVWDVVVNPERFSKHIPMIRTLTRTGDRVRIELKFKVSLFSAKFAVTGAATEVPGQSLDIRYVEGEPRDLAIRFEVAGIDGGNATILAVRVGFDLFSLGWLVSFFLKHHPEIAFGVMSGSALVMSDSLRRALV